MGDYEGNELFPDYSHRLEFMNLEIFDIYLFNMDLLFEKSSAEAIAEAKEKYGYIEGGPDDETVLGWGDDALYERRVWDRGNEPPDQVGRNQVSIGLFYESFFISLYAAFEISLMNLCDELRSPNQRTVRDIPGKGIRRSKDYLVKVLNIDEDFFGHSQGWSKIVGYRKIRNNLAHGGGKFPYIENGQIKFLEGDASEAEVLSLHEKGDRIIWVRVNKEFCSDAINVIGNFWLSLFTELSKNFEI